MPSVGRRSQVHSGGGGRDPADPGPDGVRGHIEGRRQGLLQLYPQGDGHFRFFSFADDEDTCGYLYDSDKARLAEDDDSGNDSNFRITEELEAGNKYYFAAGYYERSSTGSFPVKLVRLQGLIRAWANCEEIYVLPGESATMNVLTEATEGTVLSYAWELGLPGEYDEAVDDYPYVWTPIEGATEATYTFSNVQFDEHYRFRCTVSDAGGNTEEVFFSVEADSDLEAWAVSDDFLRVGLNDTATLEVAANDDAVSCQWYRYDVENDETGLISGATEATYTTGAITGNTRYYCRVSDDYGNSEDLYFYISIDS